MRLVPALFAIAAAATAASVDTVPPELAAIGESSTVLNVTYSVHHQNLASSLAISSTQLSTYSKLTRSFQILVSKDAPQPHLHDLGLSRTNRHLLLMVNADWKKTSTPVMTHSHSKGHSTRSGSMETYIDGSHVTSLSLYYTVLY
ncbi:hypothetical protein N7465_003005 [Penicillium sp. CMV-2018d]|nr:hypothetical protein N7465_003005 [Penicillium sp. CMV-2018d]